MKFRGVNIANKQPNFDPIVWLSACNFLPTDLNIKNKKYLSEGLTSETYIYI